MKKILLSIGFAGCLLQTTAQSLQFVRQMGQTGYGEGHSIALDNAGNIFTAGRFAGAIDFDPNAGVTSLSSIGTVDAFVARYDAQSTLIWAKQLGASGGFIEAEEIALDGNNNVYVVGQFQLSADFDPGAGTVSMTSNSAKDLFVLKLDASGNFLWARQFGGGSGINEGHSLAVDNSGNVFLGGYFSGTADFDPGAGVTNLTSFGQGDAFIVKLDATGNFGWAKQFGGTNDDLIRSVKLDGSGNVICTGAFWGTADFDPNAGTQNLNSFGSLDIFVLKLDPNGGFTWVKQFGGTGGDQGYSVASDASGNIYSTGYFTEVADFDPSAGTSELTSVGSADAYVSKLDPSGNLIWTKQLGGDGADYPLELTVNAAGKSYIIGQFGGTCDFDPSASTASLTSNGGSDAFVTILNPDGSYSYAMQLGGTNADYGFDIAIDNDSFYSTGYFQGTVDFDPGAGTASLTSGGYDIYLHKMSQTTLNINELTMEIDLEVSPNPANSVLSIETAGTIKSVSVYSTTGCLLFMQNNPTISVEHLRAGAYILVVITDSGVGTTRFIKE